MRPSVTLRISGQPTKSDHHARRKAIHERVRVGHHLVIKQNLTDGKGLNVSVDSNNARNRMHVSAGSARRRGVVKIAVPDTHATAEARLDGRRSYR